MDVGLVCDACSTFNPMGAPSCSRCGVGLSLDKGAQGHGGGNSAPSTTAQGAAQRVCPSCNSAVIAGHRFCGACGNDMTAAPSARAPGPVPEPTAVQGSPSGRRPPGGGKSTMFFGAMQAAHAKLVLIRGDGMDGVSFTLAGEEHVAGRDPDCPLPFEEDPFLSPRHSNFLYRNNKLIVRDESSANGVFVRLRGAQQISFGDRFLVGEQLLEIQPTSIDGDNEPTEDGTYFYASPRRVSRFRVVQALRGGDSGRAFRAQSDVVSFGREGNDIDFPDDPFISGHHAQVSIDGDALTLTDLNSKNGTFLRINHEHVLSHGDYVFMGQQLLRVEIV